MTKKQITEVLAVLTKLRIKNNPTLSREEKETYKQFIDELKKQVR